LSPALKVQSSGYIDCFGFTLDLQFALQRAPQGQHEAPATPIARHHPRDEIEECTELGNVRSSCHGRKRA
jgi:hypothetical protein